MPQMQLPAVNWDVARSHLRGWRRHWGLRPKPRVATSRGQVFTAAELKDRCRMPGVGKAGMRDSGHGTRLPAIDD
jgi:hypothetical protein